MPDTDLWSLLSAGVNFAAAVLRLASSLLDRKQRPTRRRKRRTT